VFDDKTPTHLNPKTFRVSDSRAIFDIYPDQWIAIAVDEITPGVGITAGHLIARGKKDGAVFEKLMQFRGRNPQQEVAFLYTGRIVPTGLDMI
jgi:hypothetical protein